MLIEVNVFASAVGRNESGIYFGAESTSKQASSSRAIELVGCNRNSDSGDSVSIVWGFSSVRGGGRIMVEG